MRDREPRFVVQLVKVALIGGSLAVIAHEMFRMMGF
jgi:hypothetical protein